MKGGVKSYGQAGTSPGPWELPVPIWTQPLGKSDVQIGMFGAPRPWLSARSVLLHVILVHSLLLSSHACAQYGLFYIGLCHYVSGTKPTFARHYPSTGQSRVPQTALCFIRRRLRYACSHNPCIFLCSLLPVDRPSSCPCRYFIQTALCFIRRRLRQTFLVSLQA